MSWRLVNRFLLWAPAGLGASYIGIGTLVGVAAQTPNKDAQALVDNQTVMWRAIMAANYLCYWLIAIVMIWVALFVWSDQKAREQEARRSLLDLEGLVPYLRNAFVAAPLSSALDRAQSAVKPTTQELHPSLFVNEQEFFPPTVQPTDPKPSLEPITGRLNATEAADTMEATGTLGLHGLYVGNIIVAAGALESEHRLEIAIIGYNGTGEVIQLSDISGRIKAGTGNLRDMVELPAPIVQGLFKANPGAEFFMAVLQDVSQDQAEEYLTALNSNKQLSLDLREWSITLASLSNPDKSSTLPLWDGVNLRRRDDIVSDRNAVMAVGMATGTSHAHGVGMAITKEDPNG